MAFDPGFVLAPQPVIITLSIEPIANVLSSMALLTSRSDLSAGVGDWGVQTAAQLPEGTRKGNELLFTGIGATALISAEPPDLAQPLGNFDAYLDFLDVQDPVQLRNRFVAANLRNYQADDRLTVEQALNDSNAYVDMIIARWQQMKPGLPIPEHAIQVLQEAHRLFNDPAMLHDLVVGHLEHMWAEYLEEEWDRVRPILAKAVKLLSQIDTGHLGKYEAIQAITGRDLRNLGFLNQVDDFERIRLVPSLHTGPYVAEIRYYDELILLFRARTPAGVDSGETLLDNAELINRLRALGDDVRLQLLLAFKEHGDMGRQEVIDRFGLDPSAASRHLRQLRANELITERRAADNKTRIYGLNPACIDTLIHTIKALLGE